MPARCLALSSLIVKAGWIPFSPQHGHLNSSNLKYCNTTAPHRATATPPHAMQEMDGALEVSSIIIELAFQLAGEEPEAQPETARRVTQNNENGRNVVSTGMPFGSD